MMASRRRWRLEFPGTEATLKPTDGFGVYHEGVSDRQNPVRRPTFRDGTIDHMQNFLIA